MPSSIICRMQRLLDREEDILDYPRWHMGTNEYAALRAEHSACLTHALRIPIVVGIVLSGGAAAIALIRAQLKRQKELGLLTATPRAVEVKGKAE